MNLFMSKNGALPDTEAVFDGTFLDLIDESLVFGAIDPVEEYGTGAVSSLVGGTGWTADGTVSNGTAGQTTLGDGRSKGHIAIANGDIVRQIALPSGWSSVRAGALVAFDDSGGNITTATCAMGLMAGAGSYYGGAARNHWLGVEWGPSLTYTRQTTNEGWYDCGAGAVTTRFQNNTRGTAAGGTIDINPPWITATRVRLYVIGFELRKVSGSSNINVYPFHTNSQVLHNEVEHLDEFLNHFAGNSWMTNENTHAFNTSTAAFATFDEATYGTLDHFNLHWNKTAALKVFGYGVNRIR